MEGQQVCGNCEQRCDANKFDAKNKCPNCPEYMDMKNPSSSRTNASGYSFLPIDHTICVSNGCFRTKDPGKQFCEECFMGPYEDNVGSPSPFDQGNTSSSSGIYNSSGLKTTCDSNGCPGTKDPGKQFCNECGQNGAYVNNIMENYEGDTQEPSSRNASAASSSFSAVANRTLGYANASPREGDSNYQQLNRVLPPDAGNYEQFTQFSSGQPQVYNNLEGNPCVYCRKRKDSQGLPLTLNAGKLCLECAVLGDESGYAYAVVGSPQYGNDSITGSFYATDSSGSPSPLASTYRQTPSPVPLTGTRPHSAFTPAPVTEGRDVPRRLPFDSSPSWWAWCCSCFNLRGSAYLQSPSQTTVFNNPTYLQANGDQNDGGNNAPHRSFPGTPTSWFADWRQKAKRNPYLYVLLPILVIGGVVVIGLASANKLTPPSPPPSGSGTNNAPVPSGSPTVATDHTTANPSVADITGAPSASTTFEPSIVAASTDDPSAFPTATLTGAPSASPTSPHTLIQTTANPVTITFLPSANPTGAPSTRILPTTTRPQETEPPRGDGPG